MTAEKDKKIWVRFGDADPFNFRQKELENTYDVNDLKVLIKAKLHSSLKDYSEDIIRLFKGNDALKSYAPISNLFNTGEEALEITIVEVGKRGIPNKTIVEEEKERMSQGR